MLSLPELPNQMLPSGPSASEYRVGDRRMREHRDHARGCDATDRVALREPEVAVAPDFESAGAAHLGIGELRNDAGGADVHEAPRAGEFEVREPQTAVGPGREQGRRKDLRIVDAIAVLVEAAFKALLGGIRHATGRDHDPAGAGRPELELIDTGEALLLSGITWPVGVMLPIPATTVYGASVKPPPCWMKPIVPSGDLSIAPGFAVATMLPENGSRNVGNGVVENVPLGARRPIELLVELLNQTDPSTPTSSPAGPAMSGDV